MESNIKIKDFMTATRFELDCGYEFLWNCYGPNACGIGWTKDDLSASANIVYDEKTHVVYEFDVWDNINNKILRWTRKGFGAKRDRESMQRGFDPRIAIDRTRFKDVSATECLSFLKRLVKRKSKKGEST